MWFAIFSTNAILQPSIDNVKEFIASQNLVVKDSKRTT